MPTSHAPIFPWTGRGARRRLPAAAAALLGTAAASLALAACGGGSSSHASSSASDPSTVSQQSGHNNTLQSFFTPGPQELDADPQGTLVQLRALGVDRVVVFLNWGTVAPDASSSHKPSFDASNPAAYPAKNWSIYDTIVRDAAQLKVKLDVVLTGSPPLWASGKGAPQGAAAHPWWEPNAQDFRKFVQAVGTRYSGHYRPKGASSPLPRIDFWSIWNEPNEGGFSLAPQTADSLHPFKPGTGFEVAPAEYRQLADAAWAGLHRSGHGSDTTVIDNFAPIGQVGKIYPGNYAVMTPIRFLRALYCVGADYKPLTGQAAAQRQCPTTAASSRKFRAENPVLFDATAAGLHPYSYAQAPDQKVPGVPDDAVLANLPTFSAALDKTQQAYGSRKRLGVYDTEFGYQTNPPNVEAGNITPAKAALWDNWGEYLHWKTPRLLSFDQYQLSDPPPVPGKKTYTRFSSGLRTYSGKDKPGYAAYRLAIFLPKTTAPKGTKLEVWGDIRTAKLEAMGKRTPAQIQFRPASGGGWKTVQQVSTNTPEGYLDVMQSFSGSGSVRLRWKYPGAGFIESRTVHITLH